MRLLSPSVLLNAWDEAAAQSAPARAIALLNAYRPEQPGAGWASASIGERDRALLRMREELFGSKLEATAQCPACGERLELAFTPANITAGGPDAPREDFRLSVGEYDVTYRLPVTADLLALGESGGRMDLLDRCVEARRVGEPVPGSRLPEEVADAVSEAMAQADPQADVRLTLDCPECAHRWSAGFDIASFLWSEIEDWVLQTLREVHALASAYGWTESEVLALSPRRRRMYLDLVGF